MARRIGTRNLVMQLADSLHEAGLDWDTIRLLAEVERDSTLPARAGKRARLGWWEMARDLGFDSVIGAAYTWQTFHMLAWYGAHYWEMDNLIGHYEDNAGGAPSVGGVGSEYVVNLIWFALGYAAGLVCEAAGDNN